MQNLDKKFFSIAWEQYQGLALTTEMAKGISMYKWVINTSAAAFQLVKRNLLRISSRHRCYLQLHISSIDVALSDGRVTQQIFDFLVGKHRQPQASALASMYSHFEQLKNDAEAQYSCI